MDGKRPQGRRHILGLTGPIACGKTTVGDLLLEFGAVARIDADAVVHGLMRAGTPTSARIAERFGQEALDATGAVDRAALGRAVFADPDALRDLEAITHPDVRLEIRRRLERYQDGVVVVDAVKLLQSDLLALCDAVWVVSCDPASEMRRLMHRNALIEDDARRRIDAMPSFEHAAVAVRIDNSGSMDDLRPRVRQAWERQTRDWDTTG
jgi:dephospho-CoA kinase